MKDVVWLLEPEDLMEDFRFIPKEVWECEVDGKKVFGVWGPPLPKNQALLEEREEDTRKYPYEVPCVVSVEDGKFVVKEIIE